MTKGATSRWPPSPWSSGLLGGLLRRRLLGRSLLRRRLLGGGLRPSSSSPAPPSWPARSSSPAPSWRRSSWPASSWPVPPSSRAPSWPAPSWRRPSWPARPSWPGRLLGGRLLGRGGRLLGGRGTGRERQLRQLLRTGDDVLQVGARGELRDGRLLGLDPGTCLGVAHPARLTDALLERPEARDRDLLALRHLTGDRVQDGVQGMLGLLAVPLVTRSQRVDELRLVHGFPSNEHGRTCLRRTCRER